LRVAAPIRRALDARNQCTREEHRVVLGRWADLSVLRTNMVGQKTVEPPMWCRGFHRPPAFAGVNVAGAALSRPAD